MIKTPRKKGPLLEVTSGGTTVKIYKGTNRQPTGREYPVYTLVYFDLAKRCRKFFADLTDAKEEAAKIAARLNRGEHEVLKLSNADAAGYVHALELLKPLGMPLHVAIAEYVHAMKLLDGRSMAEASKEFAERKTGNVTPKTVEAVVQEFLAEQKSDGVSDSYLKTLKSHLTRFQDSFKKELARVTTLQMEAWLTSIGARARTRNNLRCSLVTLFHFARKRGYLSRGVATEADEITVASNPTSSANLYSPDELLQVLKAADAQTLPAIAIAAFTGLRTASISRLCWENVKWEQGVIEVPASIAKNKKRYLAPLLPCLAAWLASYKDKKGQIITLLRLEKDLPKAFIAAGVKRLNNGLRDSFISYRVAQTMDLPKVAFEAGNSVEMIRSKYLEARTKAEAEAWFSVMPGQPTNVVAFEKKG